MISKKKLHTQVCASMSNTIRVVSCLGMARRVVWLEPDHTQWRTRWWRVTALLGVSEVPTISIYLYKYIYPYMYIYIHILIYIYVYVYVYINIYKQAYIQIYMYNCIDIHTCMVTLQLYMYICIHVYTSLSNTIRVSSCLQMPQRVVWLVSGHTAYRAHWWRMAAFLDVAQLQTTLVSPVQFGAPGFLLQ